MIVVAIASAPLAYFVIREAANDPIFSELDRWDLPTWAATEHRDEAYGSRWCVRECRFRERTWQSSRGAEETNRVYLAALRRAGWMPWQGSGCAVTGIQGRYSCWQRDEYVLDLWVRDRPCEMKPIRPTIGPSAAGTDPGASPEPSSVPGPGCGTSQATAKVFNRIAYQRAG